MKVSSPRSRPVTPVRAACLLFALGFAGCASTIEKNVARLVEIRSAFKDLPVPSVGHKFLPGCREDFASQLMRSLTLTETRNGAGAVSSPRVA